MKRLTMLIAVILIALCDVMAQPNGHVRHDRMPARVDPNIESSFEARKMKIDGKAIRFRIATVSGTTGDAPILVVFLHGSRARGNDNVSQLGNNGVSSIYKYITKNNINAVILVPQCPEGYTWSETDGRAAYGKRRQYNPYVKKLADRCVETFNIDSTRIFILGSSMGGFGVYGMIRDYPDTFAAALCASGGVLRSGERNDIVLTPVYLTVGSKEGAHNATLYQTLAEEINANGGEAECDVLEGLEHRRACAEAFSFDRLEWVFGHRR